jgi:hypothetical protein
MAFADFDVEEVQILKDVVAVIKINGKMFTLPSTASL